MEKGESRLQQLQGDVEETKDIMLENYKKAKDRGINLEELDERAEALLESSKQFQKTARDLRVKAEGENSQMSRWSRKVILIVVGSVLVLIIIIVAVYFGTRSKGENKDSR